MSRAAAAAAAAATIEDVEGEQSHKAFHVIVLGAGGGPIEQDVTGLLVRSVQTGWQKNSVLAVDAGVHLSAICRILEEHLPAAETWGPDDLENGGATGGEKKPRRYQHHYRNKPSYGSSIPGYFSPAVEAQGRRAASPAPEFKRDEPKLNMRTGPFQNMMMPFQTAKANALHFVRYFVSTYLITHAHLDHLSGFAINTASFQHTSRPKKLAALPQIISNIKTHIFNNIIWPNLSDEEAGAGLVSYQRLTEGGNLALGDGEGRGYIEVCEGLSVRGFAISHGHCMRQHSQGQGREGSIGHGRSVSHTHHPPSHHTRYGRTPDPQFRAPEGLAGAAGSPRFETQPDLSRRRSSGAVSTGMMGYECEIVDSSAFFIRDEHTGQEILIFGDVEPDSVSLDPRTKHVWDVAAPKVASGILTAVFIECSYDDSQPNETLFGHLAPRHLIEELVALSGRVRRIVAPVSLDPLSAASGAPLVSLGDEGARASSRKRKRNVPSVDETRGRPREKRNRDSLDGSAPRPPIPEVLPRGPRSGTSALLTNDDDNDDDDDATATEGMGRDGGESEMSIALPSPIIPGPPGAAAAVVQSPSADSVANLHGIKVIVIHVKDTMKDGPHPSELILRQLKERAAREGLECDISVAKSGQGIWV